MKKILLTAFTVLLLLTVCGCGETAQKLPNELAKSIATNVLVRCGDCSVAPFSGLLGSNGYDAQGDQTFCAEGFGLLEVIERVKENPSLCPSLRVDDAVSVEAPSHYNVDSLRIYDLNYQELNYSVGWDSLYTLPEGEYLIRFSASSDSRKIKTDNDDGTYTMDYYQYIFRMIIE